MLEDKEWDQLQTEIRGLLDDSTDKLYAEIVDDDDEKILAEEDQQALD